MESLVSNIIAEDYVVYAKTAGVSDRKLLSRYVIRNALLPQVTGLALQIGLIFNGALITEYVFSYPGLGYLAYYAIFSADYSLIIGIAIGIIGFWFINKIYYNEPILSWQFLTSIFLWLMLIFIVILTDSNESIKEELSVIIKEHIEETKLLREEIRLLSEKLTKKNKK